ncbi:hypothetical protein PDJAM_G00144610 [Pangasius djambal]|uniref:Uncharacterized protein n=1 Tax=Pangasius djambal TaxID=1691987 RepID=A0ACC5ZFV4_9TELE|nr:hypothetical protein [Pangasius djambal]
MKPVCAFIKKKKRCCTRSGRNCNTRSLCQHLFQKLFQSSFLHLSQHCKCENLYQPSVKQC